MALKLSAAVGDKKRITKPDPKTDKGKFANVKNLPADVELVRLMLRANGYTIEVHAKCDAGLIAMIRDFQKKKLGFKKPDGIVDPGGRTWGAGLAKLAAQVSADAKIEVYQVTEGGKTKFVSKAEYEAGEKALKHEMLSKANMMYNQAEAWTEFCTDVEQTRQSSDGFMMALAEFTVSMVNDKTDPPWNKILEARSQASILRSTIDRAKPDWVKVLKQDKKATKAYMAGGKAFHKFIDERISTASKIVGGLEIVRDTAFTVVEAYVTAKLIVTKGMSPAKANAIAAASTEALKSGAGQFGEYAAGNKVTWDSAAKKVFIDSFIAGLAGAAGGKLGAALSKGLAGKLAAKVLPKLSGKISQKVGTAFFTRFLTSKAGEAMVVTALKETIGLFKPAIEKGRPPNSKEIKEAVAKTLSAGILTHASFKALESFTTHLPAATETFLAKTLSPKVMAGMRKDLVKLYDEDTVNRLIAKHGDEMYMKVADMLGGKIVDKAAVEAINGSDGSQSAKVMQKLANESMRKDADLRKRIEAIIKSEAKRRVKKLQPAR
ncbi:peptidoglycan-binding protein [Parasedimentitalea psychrophila]|uniref:Peptidoglycan-binding protein n=1 Tax=Parasedimentitalea psychrophila TaxID=2997337 RepID=A0A9Y2KVE0_9RHOB|nr:peptidoglycan-binding protein [Parasedimentitalea psychrophila]WIY23383.1 peptidoglycan-binding protein [Parasedimentitalea psychrophila]